MGDVVAQIQPLTAQKTSSGPGGFYHTASDEPGLDEGGFLAQLGAQLSPHTTPDGSLIGMLLATTGNVQNIGGRLGNGSRGIGRESTGANQKPGGAVNLAQIASAELASPGTSAPNPAQSTSTLSQNTQPQGSRGQAAGGHTSAQAATQSGPESGTQASGSGSGSTQSTKQDLVQAPVPRSEVAAPNQVENGQGEASQRVGRAGSQVPGLHDFGVSKLVQSNRSNAVVQPASVRSVGSVQGSSSVGLGARGNSGDGTRGARNAARTAQSARPRPFHLEQKAFGAQLSNGLAAALKRSGGTVTMRLTPHALGVLRIQLELRDGGVTARFEASTDQARRLLEQNIDTLRTALEHKGLHVEKMTVRLMPQAGQEGSSSGSQDANEHEDEAGESERGGHDKARDRSGVLGAEGQDDGAGGEEVDQAELDLMGENPSETEFERDEQGYVLHLNALA